MPINVDRIQCFFLALWGILVIRPLVAGMVRLVRGLCYSRPGPASDLQRVEIDAIEANSVEVVAFCRKLLRATIVGFRRGEKMPWEG